jgi:hypothetical protein
MKIKKFRITKERIMHTTLSLGILASMTTIYGVSAKVQQLDLKWQSPVSVSFQQMILVSEKPKNSQVIHVVETVHAEPQPDPLNPLQRYICNKFGDQCKTALAVAMAESRQNPEALNKNTNGTFDIGTFQINSIHFKRCPLKQLVDPYGNIDCAFEIYSEQGWNPWVAYKNKSYLNYLH